MRGNEARAHSRPAGIAAGRVEGETGDRLAVAHTSVRTATTEVVISEKSKLELLMLELSGIAHSRMSTIRMWLFPVDSCYSAMREALASAIADPAGADRRLQR